ncbi:DUF7716 domain-containing protein [Pseudomonas huanghezhanensis]|uniref:DUF7716 domain-containing protein n=1 Tax=Pseudomonas huanghezhanensis TaxID=3002903 RepID=UPI0022861123|nr:hypothetical protein [Pseudomonas sp. BSw22131]
MIVYKNLATLIVDTEKLDKFGTLYVDREKWRADPAHVEILLLIGDDELEDLDEEGNPVLATQNDARYFFDVEIFQSVIDLQRGKKEGSIIDDYIHAINYYLESDDFY